MLCRRPSFRKHCPRCVHACAGHSQIVQQQAQALAANGMKDAGYEYVVIDEGWWSGERDDAGNIVVDPKQWPGQPL